MPVTYIADGVRLVALCGDYDEYADFLESGALGDRQFAVDQAADRLDLYDAKEYGTYRWQRFGEEMGNRIGAPVVGHVEPSFSVVGLHVFADEEEHQTCIETLRASLKEDAADDPEVPEDLDFDSFSEYLIVTGLLSGTNTTKLRTLVGEAAEKFASCMIAAAVAC